LDGKTLRVKMKGTCGTCPMSIITLQFGVQEKLNEEFPKEKYIVEQVWV
jgi:Fe-S cluster biogenesis protein NfuA